jgi:glucose-6-phosphate 1-dehydrogenase
MKFYLDNWRWQGVPLRSHGQKNAGKTILYCHTVPAGTAFHLFFWKGRHDANRLIINIQPAMDIRLQFMTKKPGLSLSLKPAEMVLIIFLALYQSPEAYETLVLDALLGDPTLFMRSDQVEEAWDVVTTIQEAWENDKSLSLDKYEAGSWGPEASDITSPRDMRGYQTRITRKRKRKRKKN